MTQPVYPPWPPPAPRPRRFVWWGAVLGAVVPTPVAIGLFVLVGVERRVTLVAAGLVGMVLLVVGLVGVAVFALFSSAEAWL